MKPLEFNVTSPFYDPAEKNKGKGKDKKGSAPKQPVSTLEERMEGLEKDIKAEFEEIEQALESGEDYKNAYKEQMRKENKLKQNNTSAEYYFTVYFADKEQRDEFLTKAGLLNKMESGFINGQQMADALQIPITKKKIEPPKSFKKHKDFTDLIM